MPSTLERRDVVKWDEPKARHQRLKTLVIFLLACRAESRERAPMKRSKRRENLIAARAGIAAPSSRELDSRLVSFRPGIGEKNFAAAKSIRETLGQPRRRFGVEDVGNVSELFGLLFDRAHDAGISMTETRDRESAKEIEIAIPVRVIQIRAVPAHERERQASIDVNQVSMREFYYFSIVHRSLMPIRFL
jgi:hypothetical protein